MAPKKPSVVQVMEVTECDSSSPLQGRLGLQGAHKRQEHVQLVLHNNFIWM